MAKVRNRFHRPQPCTLKGEFFGGVGGLAALWLPSQGLWNIILLGGFADCVAGEATRFHDSLIWSKQELRRNKEMGSLSHEHFLPHPGLSSSNLKAPTALWSPLKPPLLNANSALCFKPPVSGFLPRACASHSPSRPSLFSSATDLNNLPNFCFGFSPRHPRVLSAPPPWPQEMWCLDPDAQISYPSWPLFCPKRSQTVWFYYIFWGSQGYLFNSHLLLFFHPFSHPQALRGLGLTLFKGSTVSKPYKHKQTEAEGFEAPEILRGSRDTS